MRETSSTFGVASSSTTDQPAVAPSPVLIITQARRALVEHMKDSGFIVYDGTVGIASVPAFTPSVMALHSHLEEIRRNGRPVPYGTTLGERQLKQRALHGILRSYPYGYNGGSLDLQRIAFFPGAHFGMIASLTGILKAEHSRGHVKSAVLMQSPGYPSYGKIFSEARKLANLAEAEVSLESIQVPKGYPEAHEIRKSILQNKAMGRVISCIILTIPSNPQGKIPPREELVKIIELLSEYPSIHMILDETFLEIDFRTHDKDRFKSIAWIAHEMSQERHHENPLKFLNQFLDRSFIVRSGTKAAAIAGYRPNLMILSKNERIQNYIYEITSTILSNTGMAEQVLMAEWMHSADEAHYKSVSDHYQKDLNILTDTLKRLKMNYIQPDGGFFISICLSDWIGKQVPPEIAKILYKNQLENDEDLFNLFLKVGSGNEKLGIMPGSDFGYPSSQGFIRFCFGGGESTVRGAAKIIESLANTLASQVQLASA